MLITIVLLMLPIVSNDISWGKVTNVIVSPILEENVAHTNFDDAYAHLREWEGNYIHHPADKGGKTYGGITKRYNPDWKGWKVIKSSPTKNQKIDAVEELTYDFYLSMWETEGFSKMTNQTLANIIFDMRVNHGKKGAVVQINRALEQMGRSSINNYSGEWAVLFNDIFILPPAISKVPNGNAQKKYKDDINLFILSLQKVRRNFYQSLAKKDSSQRVFLKGWLRRADSMSQWIDS